MDRRINFYFRLLMLRMYMYMLRDLVEMVRSGEKIVSFFCHKKISENFMLISIKSKRFFFVVLEIMCFATPNSSTKQENQALSIFWRHYGLISMFCHVYKYSVLCCWSLYGHKIFFDTEGNHNRYKFLYVLRKCKGGAK